MQARHATVFASVGKGYAFQRRPETAGLSVNTAGGTGVPPGWVRLVRTGDLYALESWEAVEEGILAGAAAIPVPVMVAATLPELLDDESAWRFSSWILA